VAFFVDLAFCEILSATCAETRTLDLRHGHTIASTVDGDSERDPFMILSIKAPQKVDKYKSSRDVNLFEARASLAPDIYYSSAIMPFYLQTKL